ncbi:unnamed protein product [Rhizophagus irregularis]|nr:unnamed protein product [Rhizophagus irregularis]
MINEVVYPHLAKIARDTSQFWFKYKAINKQEIEDIFKFVLNFSFNNKKFKKGVTTGQLCLAWVIAQGDDFVTIPGTRKIKYLEENFEARKIHLSSEELSEIRKIIDSIEISGTRYNEDDLKLLNV